MACKQSDIKHIYTERVWGVTGQEKLNNLLSLLLQFLWLLEHTKAKISIPTN